MILFIYLCIITVWLEYLTGSIARAHDLVEKQASQLRDKICEAKNDANREQYVLHEKIEILQKQIDRISDNVFKNEPHKRKDEK